MKDLNCSICSIIKEIRVSNSRVWSEFSLFLTWERLNKNSVSNIIHTFRVDFSFNFFLKVILKTERISRLSNVRVFNFLITKA